MEKPKTRTPKTIQMKYPAPYSQSWPSPENEKKAGKNNNKGKKNIKKYPPLLQENLFPGCCRRNKPKSIHGPDPYAPHLKYGIFPQQASKIRNQMTTINDHYRSSIRNTKNPGMTEENVSNKLETKKPKKGQLSEAPLFVIRPIDKRHRRHLSVSEMMHLDIKPRRNMPRSPIRKSSPLFKNAIPKMNADIEYLK